MRIARLTSRADGAIAASVVMASGAYEEVIFTTAQQDGIAVASPDRAIFEDEQLDAASVRAVIAAVLAFDAVAAFSSERRE